MTGPVGLVERSGMSAAAAALSLGAAPPGAALEFLLQPELAVTSASKTPQNAALTPNVFLLR